MQSQQIRSSILKTIDYYKTRLCLQLPLAPRFFVDVSRKSRARTTFNLANRLVFWPGLYGGKDLPSPWAWQWRQSGYKQFIGSTKSKTPRPFLFQGHLCFCTTDSSKLSDNVQDRKSLPQAEQGIASTVPSKGSHDDYMTIGDVVSFLRDNFCMDLCVINVPEDRKRLKFVDYFVVVSGRSTRHLRAMAFGLVAKHKKEALVKGGKSDVLISGEECLEWMALDLGNIVVHFMLPDTREIYQLEKLWTLGPEYDDQYQKMLNIERIYDMPVSIEEFQSFQTDQDADVDRMIDIPVSIEELKTFQPHQYTDDAHQESTES